MPIIPPDASGFNAENQEMRRIVSPLAGRSSAYRMTMTQHPSHGGYRESRSRQIQSPPWQPSSGTVSPLAGREYRGAGRYRESLGRQYLQFDAATLHSVLV